MSTQIDLDEQEAGLILAAAVAVADDAPSACESVVLRKYYTPGTAASLEAKLSSAGLDLAGALPALGDPALAKLTAAPEPIRLRALAVALELASADGKVDQEELRLLARFAESLRLSLAEAQAYRDQALRELDSRDSYGTIPGLDRSRLPLDIDLSPRETVAALVTQVAVADDDPSEAEMSLIREFCSAEDFKGLETKLVAAGGSWPSDLFRCRDSILRGFSRMDRSGRFRGLVLAYRVSLADGAIDAREMRLIADYCLALRVGMGEIEACANSLESLFWRA